MVWQRDPHFSSSSLHQFFKNKTFWSQIVKRKKYCLNYVINNANYSYNTRNTHKQKSEATNLCDLYCEKPAFAAHLCWFLQVVVWGILKQLLSQCGCAAAEVGVGGAGQD